MSRPTSASPARWRLRPWPRRPGLPCSAHTTSSPPPRAGMTASITGDRPPSRTVRGLVDAREAAAWFRRRTLPTTDDAHEVASRLAGRRVSVVLPARNEDSTIGPIVKSIRQQLVEEAGLVHEIIMVDSRSTTPRRRRPPSAGRWSTGSDREAATTKGGAMQTGLARMCGEVSVYLDADIEDFDPRLRRSTARPAAPGSVARPGEGLLDRRSPGGGGGRVRSSSRVRCFGGSSHGCSDSPSRSPGNARSLSPC